MFPGRFLCLLPGPLSSRTYVLAIQVCIHRAAKPVREVVDAAVSQSEEISDHVDQLNDDSTFLFIEILLT